MIGMTRKRKTDLRTALRQHGIRAASRVALANEASYKVLLEESLRLVPRDTESLANSARLHVTGVYFGVEVFVGYGREGYAGEKVADRAGRMVWRYPWDYAYRVHINAENRVFQSGEELFLMKPLMQKRDEMRQAMRTSLGATQP